MKTAVRSIFLLIIILQGCKNDHDPCPECFTPPSHFYFELCDSATGENLFRNGTLNPNYIEIINLADGSKEPFTFLDENDVDLIRTYPIGGETEKVNYSFNVGDLYIFTLYVDAERLFENCCSFTRYNEIRIENADFLRDPNTDVYKIFVAQ